MKCLRKQVSTVEGKEGSLVSISNVHKTDGRKVAIVRGGE